MIQFMISTAPAHSSISVVSNLIKTNSLEQNWSVSSERKTWASILNHEICYLEGCLAGYLVEFGPFSNYIQTKGYKLKKKWTGHTSFHPSGENLYIFIQFLSKKLLKNDLFPHP